MKKRLILLPAACLAAFLMGCTPAEQPSAGLSVAVVSHARQDASELPAGEASAAGSAEIASGNDAKVTDLANTLNSDVEHGETLTELDGAGLGRVYRIDASDVEAAAGYTGSGATVDQISVWKATDEAAADRIWDTLRDFLDAQIENYSSYMPDEVPKLEDAVLQRSGEYIALCVSEDPEAAREIISESFAS